MLVHELLCVEIWRERVLPLLRDTVYDSTIGSTALYWVLYHEQSLVNLLEVALFHREGCECAGDDALLELTDYCHRRLVYLNASAAADVAHVERSAADMLARSGREEFGDKRAQLAFGCATCALTVLRYLSDYMEDLPPCVAARLLDTADAPMELVPLLDERPWVRHRRMPPPKDEASEKGSERDKAKPKKSKGEMVTEVFVEGAWRLQPRSERLRLTSQDAQVWLAIYNLVMTPCARAKYDWNDRRKEMLTRTRRHFNEVLFDQLPLLQDLARLVEEIELGAANQQADSASSRLVMEQVPVIREALEAEWKGRWQTLADAASAGALADSPANRAAAREQAEAMLRNFDMLELLEETMARTNASGAPERTKGAEGGDGKEARGNGPVDTEGGDGNGAASTSGTTTSEAAERQRPAGVRLVVRRPRRSKSSGDSALTEEWYAYELAVDTAKALEEVEIADEGAGLSARGVRRRLLPPTRARASEGGREAPPLPFDAHAHVEYRGRSADAKLELPKFASLDLSSSDADATIDASGASSLPKSLWVTVGLLATEGLAVQLKLKRAKRVRAAHCDAASGELYLYEVAGGAVTALIKT